MPDKSALSDAIDLVLQDEARVTAALVPGLSQLGRDDQPLPAPVLARLRLEAVRRIWASADLHALALIAMLGQDYDAARGWLAYLNVASNRDKRLLEDLRADAAQARTTPPLRATVAMFETLARHVQHLGALPAVGYALFIEWSASRSVPYARLLEPGTNGQPGDHAARLVGIAERLIGDQPGGQELLLTLLRQVSAFMRASFAEVPAYAGAEQAQAEADA